MKVKSRAILFVAIFLPAAPKEGESHTRLFNRKTAKPQLVCNDFLEYYFIANTGSTATLYVFSCTLSKKFIIKRALPYKCKKWQSESFIRLCLRVAIKITQQIWKTNWAQFAFIKHKETNRKKLNLWWHYNDVNGTQLKVNFQSIVAMALCTRRLVSSNFE